MRLSFVLFVVFSLSVIGTPAFGCTCVPPPPGTNTSQELAEWAAKGKAAIFEGRVESVQLRWKLVEARTADLVPADIEQEPRDGSLF